MKIDIIVGSTLGSAEYVADELLAELEDDHQVTIHLNADYAEIGTDGLWLVCTSTHGAGDVPDNLQPFFQYLKEQRPSLVGTKYSVIAIGSSSYDTFCGAGKDFDALLSELGASALQARLDIDVDEHPVPEEPAVEWLNQWKDQLSAL